MPRDSSGNYTLPSGNPVAAGTVIDPAWANPTMSDIALQLNNVLTRDGLLGPTNSIKMVDGFLATPGLQFISEPNTGFFRPTPQALGVVVNGVEIMRVTPTGVVVNGTVTGSGGLILPGMMLDFGGTVAPAGYLLCDGSAYSRTTYAALFAAIQTVWGAGDGTTTFNVPDMRRYVAMGAGGTAGAAPANTVGSKGGAETMVMTANQLVAHTHTISGTGHTHTLSDPGHGHGLSDPGHAHGVNDPTHAHSIPGLWVVNGSAQAGAPRPSDMIQTTGATAASGTGISIQAAGTGQVVQGAASNISIQSATPAVVAANAGASEAFSLNQLTAVVTKIIKI